MAAFKPFCAVVAPANALFNDIVEVTTPTIPVETVFNIG